MLIVVLFWLSHYFILKAAGNFSLRFFPLLNFSWFDELLTGLCVLSILSVALSLFMPLNAFVHLFLLTFSLGYLAFNKIVLPAFRINYAHLLITALILILAVPVPNHGDSAFYHAQAIKWIEHYRVIPGLGNFFGRLAFNSSFFNIQSLFSVYPFFDNPSRFLNSFLLLLWFINLFEAVYANNLSYKERLIAVLFACITLCISRGWVSSVAPDVSVGLFMIILSYKITSAMFFNTNMSPAYLLLIIFTAITIKLPAFLLLPVLSGYLVIYKKLKWGHFLIPVIVVIPWIIRNILLSGYLVYPYLPMAIWHPDWIVTANQAMLERNWISSWARIPGHPWQEVLSLPFGKWFPHWFYSQYLINKAIVVGFCISVISILIYTSKQLVTRTKISGISKILIIWGASIVLWFITAPDFRFGYGLVLPFLLATIYYFFQKYIPFNKTTLVLARNGFLTVFILLMVYVIKKEKTPLQNLVIKPQSYPGSPYSEIKTEFGKINAAPGDESCWDNPLPCINDDLVPQNIELRGTSIEEGFRPQSVRK